MVNSIKKGKTFELEVAHWLSRRLECEWHRVPQSGATATSKDLQDKKLKGDVFTEHVLFNDMIVECKHHKELEIRDLFNNQGKLWKWIGKLRQHSRYWILFVKITRRGTYILINDRPTYGLLFAGQKDRKTYTHDDIIFTKIA